MAAFIIIGIVLCVALSVYWNLTAPEPEPDRRDWLERTLNYKTIKMFQGMSEERERREQDPDWIELYDKAIQRYSERIKALSEDEAEDPANPKRRLIEHEEIRAAKDEYYALKEQQTRQEKETNNEWN
jgi:hypothetical protein